jgi:uncharacterized membrane protein
MTNGTPGSTGQQPRWLYAALVASLAVNLIVLGSAAGAFWHHRHERGESGLSGFVRDLPADRRGPLRDFLMAEREKLKPMREEMRKAWRDSNEVLGQEPFDKDKLKAAMARMHDAEAKIRATIGEAVVETAAKMTHEEREAMQKWRERKMDRKWRHRGHDD